MKPHRYLLLLIAGLLIISAINVPVRAENGASASVVSLEAISDDGTVTLVQSDTKVPRDTQALRITMNQEIELNEYGASKYYFVLKDSEGTRVPFWASDFSGKSYRIELFYNYSEKAFQSDNLKKNETYTLVYVTRDNQGQTIELDSSLKFTTNDAPDTVKYKFSVPYTHPMNEKMVGYSFSALAGPLSIIPYSTDTKDTWMVLETEQGELIQDFEFQNGQRQTVQLNEGGRYRLYVSGIHDAWEETKLAFLLKGSGLEMDTTLPSAAFRELTPYELIQNELDLALNFGTVPVKQALVYVDGEEVAALEKPGEGVYAPAVKLKPATMTEGLRKLTIVTEGMNGNVTYDYRWIIADTKDTFYDVSRGHWARPFVETMASLSILEGRSEGRFQPDAPVTREEFAKMLALSFGIDDGYEGKRVFADVSETAWSYPYIEALADAGLVEGDEVNGVRYFHPNRLITRAEAATMLGRKAEPVFFARDPFPDWPSVPSWAKQPVGRLYVDHWMDGYPDGNFYPNRNLTRAEAAKLLNPLLYN